MTRARLITAFILCFAALTGCNDALPPGGTYQSVSGTVVDAATGRPIAGAVVTVDTVLTQTTDANGKFTFDKVPVGEVDYMVKAPSKSSYRDTATQSAHLSPDKPLTLTITLST